MSTRRRIPGLSAVTFGNAASAIRIEPKRREIGCAGTKRSSFVPSRLCVNAVTLLRETISISMTRRLVGNADVEHAMLSGIKNVPLVE